MIPIEDALMLLSDEEAKYAICLTPDLFWSWYAEREKDTE